MILLDTNLLARITHSKHPQCATSALSQLRFRVRSTGFSREFRLKAVLRTRLLSCDNALAAGR
jgi:hypothetical protein